MRPALPNPARPRLPAAIPRLLRLLPPVPHTIAMTACLNQVFARALAEGELDFLAGKVVRLHVSDAGAGVAFSLEAQGRFVACHVRRRADVEVSGSLYDYLLLASGREDPDTLFFQRRISLTGDVEVGLALKNFLHAREPSPTQRRALALLDRVIALIDRHDAILHPRRGA